MLPFFSIPKINPYSGSKSKSGRKIFFQGSEYSNIKNTVKIALKKSFPSPGLTLRGGVDMKVNLRSIYQIKAIYSGKMFSRCCLALYRPVYKILKELAQSALFGYYLKGTNFCGSQF